MKNHILFSIFLLCCPLSQFCMAQSFHFSPKWKLGDKKEITVSTQEKRVRYGKLITDTTKVFNYRIEVLKITDEDIEINLNFENIAYTQLANSFGKPGADFDAYKDLILVCQINKKSLQTSLLNWQEAQKFMQESIKQMSAILVERAPQIEAYLPKLFDPLLALLNKKEDIESLFIDHLDVLLLPFRHEYKSGEAHTEISSSPNPMNPKENLACTNLTTLKSIDKANNKALFFCETVMNVADIKAALKSIIEKMMGEDVDENSIAQKKAEVDEMGFEMKSTQTIDFDTKNNWVTAIHKNTLVKISNKNGFQQIDTITTVTIE